MTRQKLTALAVIAAVVLGAGIWLGAYRDSQQSTEGDGALFGDLKAKLGDVTEIRLSKGDGSKVTLRRGDSGWTVVERNFPADAQRVRELALNLASLEIVERKTSDPANYAKLGVEAPDTPTATSTLVEVVAGEQTWALIVGKSALGQAVYIRDPKDAASALAQPALTVDPDQKRWIDRQLTDLASADVHDISVTPTKGAAYTLTRANRGDNDLTLSPVPKGRSPASAFSLNVQAEALVAFNFDDVHPLPSPAPTAVDRAIFRTFDGQVIELNGRRAADKSFVTVSVRRDPALAAQFPPETLAEAKPADPKAPEPKAPEPKAPEPKAAATKPEAQTPDAPKPSTTTVERLSTRASGVEFEIPAYKYESIFKAQEDLLEPATK
ncbi:MAG: DUF4340 domain-containing protein [Steroidobacteraceae bacterium]|nr:DUF4340 domain-containing protein [Steroidobacteraceae bacterium]